MAISEAVPVVASKLNLASPAISAKEIIMPKMKNKRTRLRAHFLLFISLQEINAPATDKGK